MVMFWNDSISFECVCRRKVRVFTLCDFGRCTKSTVVTVSEVCVSCLEA